MTTEAPRPLPKAEEALPKKWPPLPIIIVCALMVVMGVAQALREVPKALQSVESYPPGWEPFGYAVLIWFFGFFAFTIVGLWRMRRWAVIARLILHVIVPIRMTMASEESWATYPTLGPFVGWFWFVVIAACTLPYWNRMTWRLP